MNQFIAQPPRGGVTLGPHGIVDRAGVVHHVVVLHIDDVCDDRSTNTIRLPESS